jgi:hypothetical protein
LWLVGTWQIQNPIFLFLFGTMATILQASQITVDWLGCLIGASALHGKFFIFFFGCSHTYHLLAEDTWCQDWPHNHLYK